MREIAVVAGIVCLLLILSGAALLTWEEAFALGSALVGGGLLLGVPTGVYYHVLFFRALDSRGELPRGWIWHPFRYHDRLLPDERARVLAFAYLGGAGLVVLSLGLVLIVGAMAAFFARTR